MANKTYSEKLQSPQWQRKRLEILQRDDFRCTEKSCLDDKTTLHIHHLNYINGAEPWEYPDEYLTTLCKNCHEEITKKRPIHEKELINQFRLKLKDPFIQGCLVELFTELSTDDLSDIVFMLWELNRHGTDINEKITELYQFINADMVAKFNDILNKKGDL